MISSIADLTRRVERAWAEGRSDAELHHKGYRVWRERLAGLGVANVQDLRVLDIGCGDRAPLALQFAAEGARVTALDTLPVAFGLRRPQCGWPSPVTPALVRRCGKSCEISPTPAATAYAGPPHRRAAAV